MDSEIPNAESVVATFEDARDMRSGMKRFPILFSSGQNDEAALGKSRRLMSSCIKQQFINSPTQFAASTHTVASQKNTP